jgi:hypothetical protein
VIGAKEFSKFVNAEITLEYFTLEEGFFKNAARLATLGATGLGMSLSPHAPQAQQSAEPKQQMVKSGEQEVDYILVALKKEYPHVNIGRNNIKMITPSQIIQPLYGNDKLYKASVDRASKQTFRLDGTAMDAKLLDKPVPVVVGIDPNEFSKRPDGTLTRGRNRSTDSVAL